MHTVTYDTVPGHIAYLPRCGVYSCLPRGGWGGRRVGTVFRVDRDLTVLGILPCAQSSILRRRISRVSAVPSARGSPRYQQLKTVRVFGSAGYTDPGVTSGGKLTFGRASGRPCRHPGVRRARSGTGCTTDQQDVCAATHTRDYIDFAKKKKT